MQGKRPLSATEKRIRFRQLLNRKSITVMPGGFSPAYARIAELAGCKRDYRGTWGHETYLGDAGTKKPSP